MKAADIRKKFLEFFESKAHTVRPSSSLIPDDPSLLFTVAGMVPFKPMFLGQVKLDYTRAASCQKCIRTNDIENVGNTRRHHTFFEMLGNFSFGDYFKKEAIEWGWEFLTSKDWMGIDPERLWITVHHSDSEAEEMWKAHVRPERIKRLGDADNFWNMGPTGPCGPCSEIHFDYGKEADPSVADGDIEAEGDRYVEIWNLVFTQYDRQQDNSLKDLPKTNIDTGMGLERLASVMQGKTSNFETDLFFPIIEAVAKKAGIAYGKDSKKDVSLKVISDHMRSATFLIADGVLPGNEGRGYVQRHILRRAVRHARLLGIHEAFLHTLVPVVEQIFGDAYPEIAGRKKIIVDAMRDEEERFLKVLDNGLELLEEIIKTSNQSISGSDAFRLYDTWGFPLELTKEIAEERGLKVDTDGFEKEMQAQRERARAAQAHAGHGDAPVYGDLASKLPKTEFTGYSHFGGKGKVVALVKDGVEVNAAKAGDQVEVFLSQTPFYGESGGQVGDQGWLNSPAAEVQVENTLKRAGGDLHGHLALVKEGTLTVGDDVEATVLDSERRATMRHHSGTHLLHAALRAVLGDHVHQQGSYVGPDRLRFDFTHPKALTRDEKQKVEDWANQRVLDDAPGKVEEKSIDEARAEGAMALFGEKYGDTVRVVTLGPDSKELCGGTHVSRTGEVGLIKIVSEGSVSSGVRRLEALCGEPAVDTLRQLRRQAEKAAEILKVDVADLPSKALVLASRERDLLKQIEALQAGGESTSQTTPPEAAALRLPDLPSGNNLDEAAQAEWRRVENSLSELASRLKIAPAELEARLQRLVEREAELLEKIEKLKKGGTGTDAMLDKVRDVKGVKLLALSIDDADGKALKALGDNLKQKLKSGVVVLGSHGEGKVTLVVGTTPDIAKKAPAGKLVGVLAEIVGGRGGGKPEMAQAGGKDVDKLPQAIEAAAGELEKLLG